MKFKNIFCFYRIEIEHILELPPPLNPLAIPYFCGSKFYNFKYALI